MARRSKDDIANNALVQRSRPLYSLWKMGFNLFECKIFDLYLSCIDSHNAENKTVIIKKANFEQFMGLKRIDSDLLDARLKAMIRSIDIDTGGKYARHTTLFQDAYLNYKTEPYQIELKCSDTIADLLFNIEDIGYVQYRIRNIIKLESTYSYILFNYLEDNRGLHNTWTVTLDKLKETLDCNSKIYDAFKRFNDLILKKCHKELTSKTEMRYDYEPIKKGRKVIAIKFTLYDLELNNTFNEVYSDQDQLSFEFMGDDTISIEAESDERLPEALRDMVAMADDLTKNEVKEIYYTMQEVNIYPDIFPAFKRIYQTAINNEPENLKAYILTMIKNEKAKSQKSEAAASKSPKEDEASESTSIDEYKSVINKPLY